MAFWEATKRLVTSPISSYREWHRIDRALQSVQRGESTESCEFFLDALQNQGLLHRIGRARLTAALGTCWIWNQQFEEASKYFQARFEEDSTNPMTQYYLGLCDWYLGDYVNALEMFDRLASQIAPNIEVMSCRGQILAEVGRPDEARRDLNLAIELAQTHSSQPVVEAYCRNGLATAALNEGKIKEALAEITASLILQPQNAWAQFTRARIMERAGNKEEARKDYETSLSATTPPLSPKHKQTAEQKVQELRILS
jgi:Flp pilus assembly protein TadD